MPNAAPGARLARATAMVGASLFGLFVGVPSGIHAQQSAGNGAQLRVRLATTGTYHFLSPFAHVTLSEPAYVTVFEVQPDVGALMLYPYSHKSQYVGRSLGLDLASPVLHFYRQEFHTALLTKFQLASTVRTEGYFVAIASRRPLRTDLLRSGRIFAYSGGFAGPYAIVERLAELIVPPESKTDWDYDVYAFSLDQEPTLALLTSSWYGGAALGLWGYPGWGWGSAGYLFPYGTGYFGFGPFGSWAGFGGWGWYGPYGPYWPYGPNRPVHVAHAGPGTLRADPSGMTPGYPRVRHRAGVRDDGPTGTVTTGRVGEARAKRTGVSTPEAPVAEPGRVAKGRKAKQVDEWRTQQRFRQILDELGDARSSAPIDPNVFSRLRGFRGVSSGASGGGSADLAGRMEAQGLSAQMRLEHRLQRMGVPRSEALQAVSEAGGAPTIRYFRGGGAHIGGTASSAARPTGLTPSSSAHGSSAGFRTRTRSAPHVSPRAVARPRPISRPVRVSRPHSGGSRAHGGGSGAHGGGGSHHPGH